MSCHPLPILLFNNNTPPWYRKRRFPNFCDMQQNVLSILDSLSCIHKSSFISFLLDLVGSDIVQFIGDGRCRVTSVICFHLTAFPSHGPHQDIGNETIRCMKVLSKGWRITSSSEKSQSSVLHISAYFISVASWFHWFTVYEVTFLGSGGVGEEMIILNCRIVTVPNSYELQQNVVFKYLCLFILSPSFRSLSRLRIRLLSSTAVGNEHNRWEIFYLKIHRSLFWDIGIF